MNKWKIKMLLFLCVHLFHLRFLSCSGHSSCLILFLYFQLQSFLYCPEHLVHCLAPSKICLQCKNMWRNYVFLSHPIKWYSKHNAPETKLIVGFITLFRLMETIQYHERKHSQCSCGNLKLLGSAVLFQLKQDKVVKVQLDSILLDL